MALHIVYLAVNMALAGVQWYAGVGTLWKTKSY